MTAVISSTYDHQYFFYIPITVWGWNKIGINVIVIRPELNESSQFTKLVGDTLIKNKSSYTAVMFSAPKHKQATYSQISRLYAAALGIHNDEVLISSDVDMFVLRNIFEPPGDFLWNIGQDLVPEGQLPMCYTWGKAWRWAFALGINHQSFQECLDEQLAYENMEHMRGNLWSRDQELLFNAFKKFNYDSTIRLLRARPGTQFASNRYDRDDAFLLERLNPDTIDFHMNRPGYEQGNFEIILKVLKYHYPNENFQWLMDYREQYLKLLNS